MRPLFLLLAAATLPPGLWAQGPRTLSTSTTTVKGVVFDSLFSKRPLANAEVWVEGTAIAVRSDARGRYQLQDVPASPHRIIAYHPLLDSAGFSAPMRVVDLTGLESAYLTLATPDAATVYARQCPGERPRATGVLLGTVRDPGDERPVVGAALEVRWTEWTIGKKARERSTERRVTATTDVEGRFRLCGVPNDVPIAVAASFAGHTTGPIEVHLRQRAVGAHHVMLPADPSPTVTGGTLAGRISAGANRGIGDAIVRLLGSDRFIATSDDGSFLIENVPVGTQTVEIRAIGFDPRHEAVTLRPGRTTQLAVALDQAAYSLETLTVTGRDAIGMDLSGFTKRRAAGNGFFIGEDEIRRRRPMTTADIFNGVPGVQVVSGSSGVVQFRRSEGQGPLGKHRAGSCLPVFFVDGVPKYTTTEDPTTGDAIPIGQALSDYQGSYQPDFGPGMLVRPEEIFGIEIYRSLATIPPQFAKLDAGCGVIVIWTKHGKPNSYYRQDEPDPEPLPEIRPDSTRF